MKVIRFLYNLFFPIVFLVLLPAFLLRMMKRGNYRSHFGQRIGLYSTTESNRMRACRNIWIHAVSVGEVLIALKLIEELLKRSPEQGVVLSTTTSTGHALASSKAAGKFSVIYHPVDFAPFVKRAVAMVRPTHLIMVEAEVWPNLTHYSKAQGAFLALVNARLSTRSEKRYRRVRWLTSPLFNSLDAICLQDKGDYARWLSLGVNKDKLHLVGSIKFDDPSPTAGSGAKFWALLKASGVNQEDPIILAGSTHPGEELLMTKVWQEIRQRCPKAVLILVPRHTERCPQIADELSNPNWTLVRRSRLTDTSTRPDILLVDTTGELKDWYAVASVVFVGKSLCGKGGQNPAEPIRSGKPTIVGPNTQNFTALIFSLREAGGISVVEDANALAKEILDLLAHPEKAELMVHAGTSALARHDGATVRTCDILQGLKPIN